MRSDGRVLGNKPVVNSSNDGEKKTIHIVNVLDRSGSMLGEKYKIACEGINTEIIELKKDDSVNYTLTNIEFDSYYENENAIGWNARGVEVAKTETHYFMRPIAQVEKFEGKGARGGTPLYQVCGETIERFLETVKGDERVLIKIFTDGQENSSRGKYRAPNTLHDLIERAMNVNHFTITFVGTDMDVKNMIKNIGINAGNTYAHQNTQESVTRSFNAMNLSRQVYAKSVASGASANTLTTSFFSKGVEGDETLAAGLNTTATTTTKEPEPQP